MSDKKETYVRPHKRKNPKSNGQHNVKGHTRKISGKKRVPRGSSCGGSDYGDWEVDPDALEEKVRELSERGHDDKEIIQWAKDNDVFDVLKDTRYWEVLVNERPYATSEVLEYVLFNTEKGERLTEIHFESQYGLNYGGITQHPPFWLENAMGENGTVPVHDDDAIEHVLGYHDRYDYGDTREINGQLHEYVASESVGSELELQADDGELVYTNVGNSYIRVWRPVDEAPDKTQEDSKNKLDAYSFKSPLED